MRYQSAPRKEAPLVYGGRGQGVRVAGRRRGAQLTPGLLLRPWGARAAGWCSV